MTVLVVDSSVQIIERLQLILWETGNIKTAYGAVSFKDAAKFLRENKTDVVLLDGGLPGNMSIDLLSAIKASTQKTQVIILDNRVDQPNQEKYKFHGADFFFDKYNEFEKIPGIIDTILSKKNLKPVNEEPKHN